MSDSQPSGADTKPRSISDAPQTASAGPARCPFCKAADVRLDTAAPVRGRTVVLDCDSCQLSWTEEVSPQALEALFQQSTEGRR